MISRNRSAPTAAAMSIECTTSANSTVTCLYSADWAARVRRVPHSAQNLAVGPDCAPQEPQNSPGAVSPPSPLVSTSVSFHRCSAMSVISPCYFRDEVSRPSCRLIRDSLKSVYTKPFAVSTTGHRRPRHEGHHGHADCEV